MEARPEKLAAAVNRTQLRRSIGLPLLSFYGLGTVLGAGIYVLIGEVVALAGNAAPSAFVLASVLAGTSAFSFAELGGRIPKSAGEAAYVAAAFRRRALSAVVGWAVAVVGVVSAATMIRGFIGYLSVFVDVPDLLAITACTAALAAIAIRGIGESLLAVAAVTVIEIAGLVFVCVVAGDSLSAFGSQWRSMLPDGSSVGTIGVVSGAFIAFYAYIGFEDMVNVAEEVKAPERTLPNAIVVTLFGSTALYLIVAVVATLALPVQSLAGNPAPLAAVVESRGYPPEIIAAISLFAVMNGALIQMIMATRVLYGLARDGLAPAILGFLHRKLQTPIIGSLLVACVVFLFARLLPLDDLARLTSFVALSIFALVNVALLRLKRLGGATPAFSVPVAVPVAGAVLCVAMLIYETIAVYG